MEKIVSIIKSSGLLDPLVLALGLENGWASVMDVESYAVDQINHGDERDEIICLVSARDLALQRIIELLRRVGRLDGVSSDPRRAMSPWLFAGLGTVLDANTTEEEKLDRFEEVFAMLGYPDELRECSRYYVPDSNRANGIRVGEMTKSPIATMEDIRNRLAVELSARQVAKE